MDGAVPFDLGAIRAKPLAAAHAHVHDRIVELAMAYGMPNIEVSASNALGRVCVPAQIDPPTLCLGLPLVQDERADVRDFLIHRALKVLQTRTAAFARTAPIDLWPLMAAYLKIHSPSFEPAGADPGKVNDFYAKISAVAPRMLDPHTNLLASEVISTIANRASSLATLANAWGSRTALLALGDPYLAIEAIGWASGSSQDAPPDGRDRLRWIGRQAEGRDLIVFTVSDQYVALREHLGVAAAGLVDDIDVDLDS